MKLKIKIENNIAVNYSAEFISVKPFKEFPQSGIIEFKLKDNGSTRLIQKAMECEIINNDNRHIHTVIQEVKPNRSGILLKCLVNAGGIV
jgi:hypothetical protein